MYVHMYIYIYIYYLTYCNSLDLWYCNASRSRINFYFGFRCLNFFHQREFKNGHISGCCLSPEVIVSIL